MTRKLTGGCLCGAVEFKVRDDFTAFYQCHCSQCRQLTGSAFASNMVTEPSNLEWLSGAEKVLKFDHPTRQFSKAFCANCGSALPYVNKSKTALIVPAGALIDAPSIKLQANLFAGEKACWYEDGLKAPQFDAYPE